MKKSVYLIALMFAFLFTTCSKDEDYSLNLSDYRLKQRIITYEDGILANKIKENYTYDGERLVKFEEIVSYDEGDAMDYYEFSYDSNLVTGQKHYTELSTLCVKATYLIENGLTKEEKTYKYWTNVGWELSSQLTYKYSGSNLVLATYESFGSDARKDKIQYIYDGNNLIQKSYFNWKDGNWEERNYTYVYSYNGNKLDEKITYTNNKESYLIKYSYSGDFLTNINYFIPNEGTGEWDSNGTVTIDYNKNGVVSKIIREDKIEEYVYEEGKGNLLNFHMDERTHYGTIDGVNVMKSGNINNEIPKNNDSFNEFISNYPFLWK
ncbi:MAG: hypothetical protein JXR61_13355 [Prolixibacteraceae bacterium]|nr:hypothetical protein [Prolixibacteraceae bacterium]